jgi:hypothetical protein
MILHNALGALLSFSMNFRSVVRKLVEFGIKQVFLSYLKALLSRGKNSSNNNLLTALCILSINNIKFEGDFFMVVDVLLERLQALGDEFIMVSVVLWELLL